MKALLIVISLLQPLLAFGLEEPYFDETWLRDGLAPQIAKFKRTTLMPHPEHNGIIAANCETELEWWGRVRVFHHSGDKLDWIATFPQDYTENCGHYVLDCKWHHLEKLDMWVLEIFDSTHMGNGSLWLFTLEGHKFRLLLHTTACGRFLQPPPDLVVPALGSTRLVDYHLTADYRTPTGAATGAEAVFLTGTIAAFDQEDKELSTKPYAETWTWDSNKRVFTQLQPQAEQR
jgi:hypothetical protein